ncbi:MAG: hypothetical protein JWP95_1498 [Actinotalea sp.]|nr:hypothetical protein [Actinotalea sp.]
MTRNTGLWPIAATDPRTVRRSLRAEKAQLIRWRRLVRARLDLAVAAFAPPPPLGETTWEIVPEAQLALPLPHDLEAAITVAGPRDPVELMEHLRSLDRMLAVYGAELDHALETSTEQIVGELASVRTASDAAEAGR